MNYLTYFGNHIINVRLPNDADVICAPPHPVGISRADIPDAVRKSFQEPLGLPPLKELVSGTSKILIAFDDNCQPFPATAKPDIRQQALEALIPLLYSYGVKRENIQLVCAVSLHRKMKKHELTAMVGRRIMREFYPEQLGNFDAEDPDMIVELGETEKGELVELWKPAVDSDLVIYVDSIQIPLNGGHKSVAVGLGSYRSIAGHHAPKMTATDPHVMQPEGSHMHSSIERISRVVQQHCRIMVMEAAMNNATYPWHLRFLGKPHDRCGVLERVARSVTPVAMRWLPEFVRRKVMRAMRTNYLPTAINTGAIDDVHPRTLAAMKNALQINAPRQYDTIVFGLPDLSPYAIDARINPVLVISDVLGYVFNFFYNKPLVRRGGVVIILNPVFEVFHHEYHVPYKQFYEEVLAVTNDPFEIKERFQEKYAADATFRECYRHKYAYHGFHPFTVWNWSTYALKYLSRTILVGPKDDTQARRLGVARHRPRPRSSPRTHRRQPHCRADHAAVLLRRRG